MNPRAVAALNRINRRFYARQAQSFNATRSHPWPGWDRVLDPFLQGGLERSAIPVRTILDVGCGNGRFAAHLGSVSSEPFHYLGIDESVEMLALARRRLQPIDTIETELLSLDLTSPLVDPKLDARRFDLIVVFGVLHHIPGLDCRRRLLVDLAGRLEHGGRLAVSFWQFGAQQRFRKRVVDWSEYAEVTGDEINESWLETGDYLLAWGQQRETEALGDDSPTVARYCHYADSTEATSLVGSLGLTIIDRFNSDGRGDELNCYYVLGADG